MTILPKGICEFNDIQIKIPMLFFFNRNRQKAPKILMEAQKILVSLSKQNNAGDITIIDIKLVFSATVMKRAYRGHIDEWSRINDQDVNPCSYSLFIFVKQTPKQLEKSMFWTKWTATCRRTKANPYLSPCTKCSSKWIKDLDVELEAQKQLEGKVGVYFKMETLAVAALIGFNCSGKETNN